MAPGRSRKHERGGSSLAAQHIDIMPGDNLVRAYAGSSSWHSRQPVGFFLTQVFHDAHLCSQHPRHNQTNVLCSYIMGGACTHSRVRMHASPVPAPRILAEVRVLTERRADRDGQRPAGQLQVQVVEPLLHLRGKERRQTEHAQAGQQRRKVGR